MTDIPVPTSEAWDAMVEVAAQAMAGRLMWRHMKQDARDLWIGRASIALAAALTATTDQPCETCSGTGHNNRWGLDARICPDCTNGRTSPRVAHLVVAEQMGQVEPLLVLNDDGEVGSYIDENGVRRSYSHPQTSRVIGYRFHAPVPIEEET